MVLILTNAINTDNSENRNILLVNENFAELPIYYNNASKIQQTKITRG